MIGNGDVRGSIAPYFPDELPKLLELQIRAIFAAAHGSKILPECGGADGRLAAISGKHRHWVAGTPGGTAATAIKIVRGSHTGGICRFIAAVWRRWQAHGTALPMGKGQPQVLSTEC